MEEFSVKKKLGLGKALLIAIGLTVISTGIYFAISYKDSQPVSQENINTYEQLKREWWENFDNIPQYSPYVYNSGLGLGDSKYDNKGILGDWVYGEITPEMVSYNRKECFKHGLITTMKYSGIISLVIMVVCYFKINKNS